MFEQEIWAILSKVQYKQYTVRLRDLLHAGEKDSETLENTRLLRFFIKKWDEGKVPLDQLDPVILLRSLLHIHRLTRKALNMELKLYYQLRDILNYNAWLSKKVAAKLGNYFKLPEELFYCHYEANTMARRCNPPPGNMTMQKRIADLLKVFNSEYVQHLLIADGFVNVHALCNLAKLGNQQEQNYFYH
jgi:antitoxin component HigA of HigAB toxin-antitoxin module